MIYLDNASTSYPKPPELSLHLAHLYDLPLGSYGRSRDAHTLEVSTSIELLRDKLAALVGHAGEGEQVLFTKNATEATNTVIKGLEQEIRRCGVWISPLEHHAVTRPLRAIVSDEAISLLPYHSDGTIDTEQLPYWLRQQSAPPALCVINAMSNVNGVMQPLCEVVSLLHDHFPMLPILVDAAQGLPHMTIPPEVDYVAITGHKGLLGPTGTGALYIAPRRVGELPPLLRGGTGFRSEEWTDTLHLPERYEAGTLNMLGLSAWAVAMEHRPAAPLVSRAMWVELLDAIESLGAYRVLRALDSSRQGGVASLVPLWEESVAAVGDRLYADWGIATRVGLHCAPLAHRTLGTLQSGSLRLSLSPYTSSEELSILYTALCHVIQ